MNSSAGRSVLMTSSNDRKWSGGGPVCSMLRVMLDVTLLQRVTFIMLSVSVLLCYFGQLLELFLVF